MVEKGAIRFEADLLYGAYVKKVGKVIYAVGLDTEDKRPCRGYLLHLQPFPPPTHSSVLTRNSEETYFFWTGDHIKMYVTFERYEHSMHSTYEIDLTHSLVQYICKTTIHSIAEIWLVRGRSYCVG